MKKFFSKIKDGFGKAVNKIKSTFSSVKTRISKAFQNLKLKIKKNREDKVKTQKEKNNKKVKNQENININEPIVTQTIVNTKGTDATVARTSGNKNINRNNNAVNNNLNSQNTIDNNSSEQNLNEKIISISIQEDLGIVEYRTENGNFYQEDIQDIMNHREKEYANHKVNEKCKKITKNKIEEIRLKRKLNPVVITILENDEDIYRYMECVQNNDELWFDLEHNLIDSMLEGQDARIMNRAAKSEEKMEAYVERETGIIEKILKIINDLKGNEKSFTNEDIDNAITAFNIGNTFEEGDSSALKYYKSALKIFENEDIYNNSDENIQHLEEILLKLQAIYIKQKRYQKANEMNQKYMDILSKEKSKKYAPLIIEARKTRNKENETEYLTEYIRKYTTGQRGLLKILSRTGKRRSAIELYNKMLKSAGIELKAEEFRYVLNSNCIENGEYIVLENGKYIAKTINGDEKFQKLAEKAKPNVDNTRQVNTDKSIRKNKTSLDEEPQVKMEGEPKKDTKVKPIENSKIKDEENMAEEEKRYNEYCQIISEVLEVEPLKDLKSIKDDEIHKIAYMCTSENTLEKATGLSRIGHFLVKDIEENAENAKKYLEKAINTILDDKNLSNKSLYNNERATTVLETSYLDLAGTYILEEKYDMAKEKIKDYKELMEKEFNFKYTPLISEAKSKGEKIKMLNNMIEIKSKYTKADILLVRIAALENSPDAIEQYDNLLKKSGIVLSDEERNESIRLKGNVNGTYVRIGPDNSTIDACKIVGAEDLLIKRQILQEKAIEEAKAKFAKEI